MSRTSRGTVGITASAALALTMAGAVTGAVAAVPQVRTALARTPSIHVTVTTTGTQKSPKYHFTYSGPKTFGAGRVSLSLTAVHQESEIDVVSLKKGYTLADFAKDAGGVGQTYGATGITKAGAKLERHEIAHSTLIGGLDTDKGKTEHATIVFPNAGTYYLFEDDGSGNYQTITVTGKPADRATPASDATVKAESGDRFAGSKTLPAKGNLTFSNVSAGSSASPHFLILQHVKSGTTTADLRKYFASGVETPPSFEATGDASTDALSPGRSMTLQYSLPKGEYVELCFYPDPKTGMYHALMGMYRIVSLR